MRKFMLVPLAFIFLPILSESASLTASLNGAIYGQVTDASTGHPVAAATVTLILAERSCPLKRIDTDDKGEFLITGLQTGRYILETAKDGFQRSAFGADPEHPSGQEFLLTPALNYREFEIQLHPSSAMSGHVYDSNGLPVAGGHVSLGQLESGRIFHKKTDSQGFYSATDLPPGSYTVSARRYSPTADQGVGDQWYFPGTIHEADATPIFLEVGKSAAIDIYFQKEREPIWIGKAIGPEGEPVALAEFTFIQKQGDRVWYKYACRTSADGTCEIRELPAGDYWVLPHKVPPPYAGWRNWQKAAGSLERYALPVQIIDGKSSVTAFELEKGKTLNVTFRLMDGSVAQSTHGIEFTLEHLINYQGLALRAVSTAVALTTDTVSFSGLHAGEEYVLAFRNTDPEKYYSIRDIQVDGTPLVRGDTVQITDQELHQMDVMLDRSATVAGAVKGEYDAVVAARLQGPAVPEKLYKRFFRTTVELGRFLFSGLPEGTYRIHGETYQPKRKGDGVLVTVRPGEMQEITLE